MTFSDEERAEMIAALSHTADMVAALLDALDVLRAWRWRLAGSRPMAICSGSAPYTTALRS